MDYESRDPEDIEQILADVRKARERLRSRTNEKEITRQDVNDLLLLVSTVDLERLW